MAASLTDTGELTQLINANHEWLLVRESGASFPVDAGEIEVTSDRGRPRFGFLSDSGFKLYGLQNWSCDGSELAVEITSQFKAECETIRLVPRTSAAELTRAVELARLERAGEIART